MSAVSLKNIVKKFGGFTAVHRMSMDIPDGSFVTLLNSDAHPLDAIAKRHAASALISLCKGGRPRRLMDPTDVKEEILDVLTPAALPGEVCRTAKPPSLE